MGASENCGLPFFQWQYFSLGNRPLSRKMVAQMVVSPNKDPLVSTPKFYIPYYGEPQKGTPGKLPHQWNPITV